MENIPDDVSEEVSEKKVKDLSANLISSTSHSIKGGGGRRLTTQREVQYKIKQVIMSKTSP